MHKSLPDVSVVAVTRQTLENWVSTNGVVEPEQPYLLESRMDTFVKEVAVVEGQAVRRGQLLLVLESTKEIAQLAQARQQFLTAQRQLEDARAGGSPDELAEITNNLTKAEASRNQLAAQQNALTQLVTDHAATPEELPQNRRELAQAEADVRFYRLKKQELARRIQFDADHARLQIEQAQAQISELTKKVTYSRVVAPVNGTVYALPARTGNYVHLGGELAAIADLHEVRVVAYVDEMDLGAVEQNQLVQIQWDAIPGRVWTGGIQVIPKAVVSYKDRSVGKVLCSTTNRDLRLLPNTHVDVTIRVERRTGTLVVPRAAVQGGGAANYVFIYRAGGLHRQLIQVGIAGTSRLEVLEGLAEGERVAIPGAVNLTDGLKIHPMELH